MDIVIPGASKNDGTFKSSKYGVGEHELEVKTARWNEDKLPQEATLVVEFVITDGPNRDDGKSPVGGKYTAYLKQRFEAKEDWMIESDTTRIVQLINALGLKIPKSDKLPIKDMPGCVVKAKFERRTYTDKSGVEKEIADVAEWKNVE